MLEGDAHVREVLGWLLEHARCEILVGGRLDHELEQGTRDIDRRSVRLCSEVGVAGEDLRHIDEVAVPLPELGELQGSLTVRIVDRGVAVDVTQLLFELAVQSLAVITVGVHIVRRGEELSTLGTEEGIAV